MYRVDPLDIDNTKKKAVLGFSNLVYALPYVIVKGESCNLWEINGSCNLKCCEDVQIYEGVLRGLNINTPVYIVKNIYYANIIGRFTWINSENIRYDGR